MSNNDKTKEENEGMENELTEFMENFKEFLELNDIDPDKYDDTAFQMMELMVLHDSYVQEIMRYKQETQEKAMKQQQKQQKAEQSNIVTPDFDNKM